MGRLLLLLSLFCSAGAFPAGAAAEPAWINGIPLDKAIRIGSGPHVVVEVSDPDCRFSRRMARYWSLRRDVTRYVFLVGLNNHPEAPAKARHILCAADRAVAYQSVFSGGLDFEEHLPERPCDDHGLFDRHREVADRLRVIGTPTYVVDGVRVDGAKVGEIERILGGEKIPFDASDPD